MKEFGGYIEWEGTCGKEYYEDLYRFDSIRSALHYVIKKRGYRKLWIPYYLCGCVPEFLESIALPVERYHIGENFWPVDTFSVKPDECLLLVNFYGQFTNEDLCTLKQKYTNIFVDNTQSFFQRPVPGIDTGYTCRKYFGVPDGGYLSTDLDADDYEQLELDFSYHRMEYILGRFETDSNSHYPAFAANDMMPRGTQMKRMSRLVSSILSGMNYEAIIQKRKENFAVLHQALKTENRLQLNHEAGLYLYPFLCRNGGQIKRELIARKIYVPTLWSEVFDCCPPDSWEYDLADNLVLLPMDQRYSDEDMKYILDTLTEVSKKVY